MCLTQSDKPQIFFITQLHVLLPIRTNSCCACPPRLVWRLRLRRWSLSSISCTIPFPAPSVWLAKCSYHWIPNYCQWPVQHFAWNVYHHVRGWVGGWAGAWVNCVSTMAAKYPLQKSLGQIWPNLWAKCKHSTVAMGGNLLVQYLF